MLENLPTYITVTFGLTTVVTLLLLIWTIKRSTSELTIKKSTLIFFFLTIWLAIQAVLTIKNIYNSDITSVPPKIVLFGILPAILTIVLLFATHKGRQFIDSLPLKNLTYVNVVRILVELVLWWLFLHKAVPELMTFEGWNFDIIAGSTAPFAAYFGFTKEKLNKQILKIC